jgi:3-isopropylmalate/(R)-2-methylmalate dehydratase small subunit
LLANNGVELSIDVTQSTLKLPDGRSLTYPIDAFARYCLTHGIDQLGYLLNQQQKIESFEEGRPWQP